MQAPKLPALPANVPPWAVWAGLALVAAGVAYAWRRGVSGVVQDALSGAATVADGVVSGVVKGAGQVVGIPDTGSTQCAAAKAAGNTLDVSLYCPALDFLKWVAGTGEDKPREDAGGPYQTTQEVIDAIRYGGGQVVTGPDGKPKVFKPISDKNLGDWGGYTDMVDQLQSQYRTTRKFVPVAGLRG